MWGEGNSVPFTFAFDDMWLLIEMGLSVKRGSAKQVYDSMIGSSGWGQNGFSIFMIVAGKLVDWLVERTARRELIWQRLKRFSRLISFLNCFSTRTHSSLHRDRIMTDSTDASLPPHKFFIRKSQFHFTKKISSLRSTTRFLINVQIDLFGLIEWKQLLFSSRKSINIRIMT